MATKSEAEPLGMPSACEVRTMLDAEELMEGLHEQPLGWQGVLHCVVDPAPPPLTVLGWEARTPVAIRVGAVIIRREPGEGLDHLRLRVARQFGGLGVVGHYCYPRGTR